jgi:1-acyl-sn-glycerol-3-phosphate acyltransferase
MKHRLTYLYRWIMWNVFSRLFVRFYLYPKYHFTKAEGSKPLPKPPFVIVANHGTFFDPWIVGYYSRYPFAIMCNDEAFSRGAVSRWYLNSIGAFPKKKGASDFRAMKKTVSRLSKGYPVCIFPEGQTSWDGQTQLIYKGIEKIARHAGASLVLAKVTGNFLTKPWWADVIRKGRITVAYDVVPSERVKSLSDDDLFSLMKSYIAHNDVKDPANTLDAFSGKDLALGLERFVWMCPSCETEDRLVTSACGIRCSSCGAAWEIDAAAKLTPANSGAKRIGDLNDWALWHRARVLSKINSAAGGETLTTSTGVVVQTGRDNFSFLDKGTGTLFLTAQTLTFAFDRNASPPLSFPVKDLETVVIQKRDIVEFGHGGLLYRFVFSRHSPMKWIYYLRYLKGYQRCEEQGFIS